MIHMSCKSKVNIFGWLTFSTEITHDLFINTEYIQTLILLFLFIMFYLLFDARLDIYLYSLIYYAYCHHVQKEILKFYKCYLSKV